MAIIRTTSHIETYRAWAAHRTPDWLAGRGEHRDRTRAIARRLISQIDLQSDDSLLDIGCGDGSLIRAAVPQVKQAVGLCSTTEERDAVAAMPGGGRFEVGVAQALPFPENSFSITVANGVLLLMPTMDDLAVALKEMFRVTKPAGRVFVGEMPFTPEHGDVPQTATAWWARSARTYGVKGAISAGAHLLRCVLGMDTLILQPADRLHVPELDLVEMAKSAGLILVDSVLTPHAETRRDYLFRRP